MAKTVLVLIVLVMFSIGLFIVSKVGVFLKESKKEASDEREGVQLVKILEGIPGRLHVRRLGLHRAGHVRHAGAVSAVFAGGRSRAASAGRRLV